MATTSDCLIVGGGVVGLSLAYELAREGVQVTLLERGSLGGEASWAGAGILPPASWYSDHASLDQLALRASSLYPAWSKALHEATDIDNEYWSCGSIYPKDSESSQLAKTMKRWRGLGIDVQEHATHYGVPQESQVRNPRHLRALAEGCRQLGATLHEGEPVVKITAAEGQVTTVLTPSLQFEVGHVIFAAGCWSPSLANQIGITLPGRPVRGQVVLLRPKTAWLEQIIHVAPHYLVPRRDGLVLVGATVEMVGFDRRNTREALATLLAAARSYDPRFEGAEVEAFWAGLRPGGGDGLPQIGALDGYSNVWAATGHYRAGLQLAPATAELLSCLIRGVAPPMDPAPFSPERFALAGAG